MKINTTIREKYHKGFDREGEPITELVYHGTGGGVTASGLIIWMFNDGRPADYKKGVALFHYLIDLNGEVTEIISPENWVFHSSSGLHDSSTIGIEMINGNAHNENEYTANQYSALMKLTSTLMKKYPITSIVGHGQNKLKFSGMYKECPGIKFRWDIIENDLLANGYTFTKSKERISNIKVK